MKNMIRSLILSTLIFLAPLVQKSQEANAGIIIAAGSIYLQVKHGYELAPVPWYGIVVGGVLTAVGIIAKGKGAGVVLFLDESAGKKDKLAEEIFNHLPDSSEVDSEVKDVIVSAIRNQLEKFPKEGTDKFVISLPETASALQGLISEDLLRALE